MTKQDSKTDRPLVTSNTAENVVLTAYQAGPAVVHEDRRLHLGEGLSRVYVGGLPREFVDNSSTIVAVRGTGKFAVGAKSLRPANLTFHAMLNQSIGKRVTFVEEMKNGNLRKTVGTLLHIVEDRYAVLEGPNGKGVQVVPLTQKFELEAGIPTGLSNLSVLVLDPKVEKAGDFTVELLYETGGINWSPKYEVFYDAKTGIMKRFACNVDLTNNSGANFEGVVLNLIAGTNVSDGAPAYRKAMPMRAMAASLEMVAGAAPQADYAPEAAAVETVGEQKMYKLNDPVTLENGIPNSPVLVFCENVPAKREYHVYAHGYHELDGDNKNDLPKLPVNVKLRVQNDKDNNLGRDLPPGAVRFFEPDQKGKLQKTDSSQVKGHISIGEEFSLDLRNACKDLKHTRELVEHYEDPEAETTEGSEDEGHFPIKPQVGATVHRPVKPGDMINHAALEKEEEEEKPRFAEEEREVTVMNYKGEAVEVTVHESFPANATLVSNTQEFAKVNMVTGSGTFKLTVPAKGEKEAYGSSTVRYRVRYRLN